MADFNEPTVVSLDEVMAGLEGEPSPDYEITLGITEGSHPATITKVEAIAVNLPEKGDKPAVTFHKARITVELTEPRFSGWERHIDYPLGKYADGNWADGNFRTSVRRVLGEAVYANQIATIPTASGRYKKAFDLLVSRPCEVFFKKNDKGYVNPVGVLSGISSESETPVSSGISL